MKTTIMFMPTYIRKRPPPHAKRMDSLKSFSLCMYRFGHAEVIMVLSLFCGAS
jgi:hypothetical protein